MLRRRLECGGAALFRSVPVVRLFGDGHDFPVGRFRLPVQDSHRDEARRHQDRQAREANDPYRHLLRTVHGASADSDRLFILRTNELRYLDAHLDEGHVQETTVFDSVPAGPGSGSETLVRSIHDQIFNVHDSGDHLERLDMVGENRPQLASVLQSAQRTPRRSLRMKPARTCKVAVFYVHFHVKKTDKPIYDVRSKLNEKKPSIASAFQRYKPKKKHLCKQNSSTQTSC